jgi:hypothetical protein
MTAYRDDLEATLLRAAALEREVAELRERNQRLEAGLTTGDMSEATRNARRLAAALAREQEEQRVREEADVDERAARALAKARRHWSYRGSPSERRRAMVLYGVITVLKVVVFLVAAVAAFALPEHR